MELQCPNTETPRSSAGQNKFDLETLRLGQPTDYAACHHAWSFNRKPETRSSCATNTRFRPEMRRLGIQQLAKQYERGFSSETGTVKPVFRKRPMPRATFAIPSHCRLPDQIKDQSCLALAGLTASHQLPG
jgi:hypothetical protein